MRGDKKGIVRFWIVLLMVWLGTISVAAQGETAVESLSVQIWPDYDQPNVLVLLMAELTDVTPLPATVTIPLPPEATVHVVAYLTEDGVLTDDIAYTETADSVTLTTVTPSFRVEYYYPYLVDGDQHSFTFNWQGEMAVNQMSVSVQQPASAVDLVTEPEATAVSMQQSDGLTYHTLPLESVAAGQDYDVSIRYQMASPLLTVNRLQNQVSSATAVAPAATVPTATPSWALYLAAVGTALIGIAMFWQAYNSRQKRQRPVPRKQADKASFCHNCGQRRQLNDQFCRHCGTALK